MNPFAALCWGVIVSGLVMACAAKPKPCPEIPPAPRMDDPNAFPIEYGHAWDALSK